VLMLLWRGIAQYATCMGLRYLIGCSSINSQQPAEGWQIYNRLQDYRVPPEFETTPTDAFACPIEPEGRAQLSPLLSVRSSLAPPASAAAEVKVPKLLRTYLAIGARIAAPPAWDRAFGTIDFLTVLDLKLLSAAARNRFLSPLTN
jgi:putative hemolysin